MTEFRRRSQFEAELAEILGQINSELAEEILKELGDPPDLTKLTPEVWSRIKQKYTAAIEPELEKIFIAAVEDLMAETTIAIDWTQINERASRWARQYTEGVARKLAEKADRALGDVVSQFYDDQLTLGELTQKIYDLFGTQTADLIAVTETTRAAVEGERMLIEEIERLGVRMGGAIQTNQDELVCPICAPKQGENPDFEGYPPYHPRCRCWVNWEPAL